MVLRLGSGVWVLLVVGFGLLGFCMYIAKVKNTLKSTSKEMEPKPSKPP